MKKTTFKILKELNDNGYKAYVIGGYVRDMILKRKCYDVDICTNATPKEIKNLFNEANISKLEYGSITLTVNNIIYEITTFRQEIKYINNRKPVQIKYIDDLYIDLLRRDFTINTICMNKNGKIIDLLNGIDDLKKKQIVCVGNPYAKLEEDSLRILRAIRFATTLNFTIDNQLECAIIKNKKLLENLSYERKKSELNKIFLSPNKEYGISLLQKYKLDKVLELNNMEKAKKTNDLIGIWSIITDDNGYLFTKNEQKECKKLKQLLNEDLDNDYVLYKYGLYLSTIAGEINDYDKKKIIKRYNKLSIKQIKDIKITSMDICKILNKRPGNYLREIQTDLENNIVMHKINNNKQNIEKYIKEKYNS